MSTKNIKKRVLLSVVGTISVLVLVMVGLFTQPQPAQAAINEQVNYQGRLLTNTGAVVNDGTYNIRFKIYQGGNGCVGGGTSPCSGTLKWTETRQNSASQGVRVSNGYFSVNLGSVTAFGSSVDWDQATLWLSIDVGGTATGGSPTYDGELLPFRRLTSVPSAMQSANSTLFNGLQTTAFVQLAQGVQTDASTTNASIFINKTGGTADILTLQRSGTSVMNINNIGGAAFRNSTDSTLGFTVYDADLGTPVFNIDTTNERVGIGTNTPEDLLEVQGVEATNATIVLDADDGDDAGDSWFLSSLASDNSLSFRNDATEVANLTNGGNLQIDGNLSLNTVTSGTWNGTDIAVADGGTGSSTSQGAINNLSQLTTNGDLLYHNGTNSTRLAKGADTQCLKSTTTTLAWGACSSGVTDLQGAYDGGNTITLTNARDLTFTAPDTATDPNVVVNLAGDTSSFTIQDGGTAALQVNANGQTILGGTTPVFSGVVGLVQLSIVKDNGYAIQGFEVHSATPAESGAFYGVRGRGTMGSPSASQSGDTLFSIGGVGYNTSNMPSNLGPGGNASIDFVQDAASTATTAPAKISFKTGSSSEKMVIQSNGNVGVGDTSPISLFTVGAADAFQINASGAVLSGTWNGTDIAVADGGTGSSTSQGAINNLSQLTTEGDILFRNSTNSTRLPKGVNGECLKSTAATVAWGSCSTGAVTLQGSTPGTADTGNINVSGAIIAGGAATFGGQVTIGTSNTTGTLLVLDTKTDNNDPTGTNGGTYYNSFRQKFRCYEDSVWVDCSGVTQPNTRSWGYWKADGSTTAPNAAGERFVTTGTVTAVAGTATDAPMVQIAPAASLNATASVSGNSNYTSANKTLYQTYATPTVTTLAYRYWIGLTTNAVATQGGSDSPTGHYAMFRYSSTASDPSWQCVTNDNSGGGTATSSGVAAAQGVTQRFEIFTTASAIIFVIDGVQVCSRTTDLPGSTQLMQYMNVSTNNGGSAVRALRTAWVYLESDL
jgi:hypothetical protein